MTPIFLPIADPKLENKESCKRLRTEFKIQTKNCELQIKVPIKRNEETDNVVHKGRVNTQQNNITKVTVNDYESMKQSGSIQSGRPSLRRQNATGNSRYKENKRHR